MSKRNRLTKLKNLDSAVDIFDVLIARDFKVHQFSEYHWRINDTLDIWPSSKKAYDIKAFVKYTYKDLEEFVMEYPFIEAPKMYEE